MNELQRRVSDEVIRSGLLAERDEAVCKTLGEASAEAASETPGAATAGADIGPMKRGGRPTVFSPELRERIEMLLSVGMSRRQASAYVGIDPTTLVKAAARDPEFAVSLRIAEEQASVNPLLTIISESRKNWRAAAWLLNHRKGWPVDRAPKTEEEKELEHQEQLREDARSAERSKLQMMAMREVVEAGATKVVRQETTMSPGWKKHKR